MSNDTGFYVEESSFLSLKKNIITSNNLAFAGSGKFTGWGNFLSGSRIFVDDKEMEKQENLAPHSESFAPYSGPLNLFNKFFHLSIGDKQMDTGARIVRTGKTYNSIQKAINEASNGDTIVVKKGEYRENLTVDKNITLKANESRNVVIKAEKEFLPVLLIGPSDIEVKMDGLVISDAQGEGCRNFEGGICPAGLVIVGRAKGTVEGSVLIDNASGVVLLGSSEIKIIQSKIVDNEQVGIVVTDSSHIALVDSKIVGNKEIGLRALLTARVNMENSEVSHHDKGIVFSEEAVIDLKRNLIRSNYKGIKNISWERFAGEVNGIGNILSANSVNFSGISEVVQQKLTESGPIKAYRNINFGDSKSQVKQKIEQDEQIPTPYWSLAEKANSLKIEGVKVAGEPFNFEFQFFNDKLYQIIIHHDAFLWEGESDKQTIQQVKRTRDLLVEVISGKYDSPSRKEDVDPSEIPLNEGVDTHDWDESAIGEKKEISIGIVKAKELMTGFIVGMSITQPELQEEKSKQEAKEKEDEKKESISDF